MDLLWLLSSTVQNAALALGSGCDAPLLPRFRAGGGEPCDQCFAVARHREQVAWLVMWLTVTWFPHPKRSLDDGAFLVHFRGMITPTYNHTMSMPMRTSRGAFAFVV